MQYSIFHATYCYLIFVSKQMVCSQFYCTNKIKACITVPFFFSGKLSSSLRIFCQLSVYNNCQPLRNCSLSVYLATLLVASMHTIIASNLAVYSYSSCNYYNMHSILLALYIYILQLQLYLFICMSGMFVDQQ